MRILFIGCVKSSQKLLEKLLKNQKNVVGVITKESSTFNADFTDLTPLCRENGIPYHLTTDANDEKALSFVKSLSPDICLCFGWSHLLKEELIKLFPQGAVGFHPAALPQNRGRHPLVWALALGLKETASTFFAITPGADEGDILSQENIEIEYEDDAGSLYDKVIDVAVRQEIQLVDALEKGCISPKSQGGNAVNYWRKRGKADGQIDFRMSSRAIYNLVRSLTRPYVGAHLVYKEKEYKVWRVQELNLQGLDNIEPGKVLAVNPDGTFDIKAYDGGIRLVEFDPIDDLNAGDYI